MEEPQPQRVVFSSGGVETRTSLDTALNFYWEPGDKILVDIGGTWTPNDYSSIMGKTRAADFYFDGVTLGASGYDVLYTGTGANPSATHVAIARTQTQAAWGDARLRNGVYRFILGHKAHYLIFQPFKDEQITADWKLIKIEIITDGTTKVAGEYSFGTG